MKKRLRGLGFSLSEHIPVARWCLALVVIAFAALVSVYKYIDLADTATFSALEVLFLILTDAMNIVFIYLPLYLFIVSGISFDRGYGGIEVLRCGSRNAWLGGKLVTYLLNTLIFFTALILINVAVCAGAFSFSSAWSGDFVGFRVMSGQPAADFSVSPIPVIISACCAVLMFYVFCGVVNLLAALISGREAVALFTSLFIGIAFGLANMLVSTNGLISQLIRCGALLAASAVIYAVCLIAVRKKNFGGKKMY